MSYTLQDDNGVFTLKISAYDIIHDVMTGEQRNNLIQSLACLDEIIKRVTDQILYGYTDDGFCGVSYTDCSSALQKARIEIVKECNPATRKVIESLERRIQTLEKDVEWYRSHKGV